MCQIVCFLCKFEKRYITDFLILITFLTFDDGTIHISHKTNIKIQRNNEPGNIGRNIGIVEIKINIIAKNNLNKKGVLELFLI